MEIFIGAVLGVIVTLIAIALVDRVIKPPQIVENWETNKERHLR